MTTSENKLLRERLASIESKLQGAQRNLLRAADLLHQAQEEIANLRGDVGIVADQVEHMVKGSA